MGNNQEGSVADFAARKRLSLATNTERKTFIASEQEFESLRTTINFQINPISIAASTSVQLRTF